MRDQTGITFIELTVVMLVIGLVVAVAMPNFMGLLSVTKAGSAGRGLAGYMKYLQSKAVRDNTQYIILFDLPNRTYWAAVEVPEVLLPIEYYSATPDEKIAMRYRLYKDEFIKPVTLPPEVSIPLLIDDNEQFHRDTDYYITDLPKLIFYPDGTATQTTIYLLGPRESVMTLHVSKWTGETVFYDGHYEPPRYSQYQLEEEE